MNNIFKSALLLMAVAFMFTACSDDRDSNPVLQQPDSFVLNTPAYAGQAIDLANSQTVNLTWSQPDYGGFPVAAEYTVELSATNEWTIPYSAEVADESGETQCNYFVIENIFSSCNAEVSAADVAKAIVVMCNYADESEIPAQQELYARVKANTPGAKEVVSNVVKFLVSPYYIELKPADPVLWYMVGNCIGSNDWDNGSGSVGTGLIPLLPMPDADVDNNGNTVLVYAGYFPEGGQFKFIKIPGSWDTQMNYTNLDGDSPVTDEDGDNHNIGIPEAGYYKIEMNTATNKFTMVKYEETTPKVFETITMPGDYQGWDAGSTPMTAMGKRDNTETHDWYLDATYAENAELKFANGSWDINWGANSFPLGYGTQGGPNIPVKAGAYRVFFNDILGLYYFMATE
ncbi:MAG: SusF/SusE family outer membrane protein [Muribaculaceae bacterium]|nr:SusF/SusE family outer membrane protein [Muribaculaceae bacterium]